MDILNFIKGIKPKILVEIGAHFGTETETFRQILPESDIICFEPDPRNLKILKDKKIHEICKLEEMAVSEETGISTFHLSSGDCKSWATDDLLRNNDWSASSSLKKPKGHLDLHRWVKFEEVVEVKTIRLDDYEYLRGKTIDFIWMDVQGAEDLVFKGAKNTLKNTKYLYTEYNNNELYEDQLNLQGIQNSLGSEWEIIHVYENDVLLKNKTIA